jgi:hypothetical protein
MWLWYVQLPQESAHCNRFRSDTYFNATEILVSMQESLQRESKWYPFLTVSLVKNNHWQIVFVKKSHTWVQMYRIGAFNSVNINHEVQHPSVQHINIFLQKQIIRLLMITELQYKSQLLSWMWIVTGSYVYACMHAQCSVTSWLNFRSMFYRTFRATNL